MSVASLSRRRSPNAALRYPYSVRQALKFAGHIERGSLEIVMPDGESFMFGDGGAPSAVMKVRDLSFARSLAHGDIGIAEAFLRGEWDSPDLTAFLELFCVNQPVIARLLAGKPVVRAVQMARHWLNRNTRAGSRRNIHAHYDLGNSFYSKWLDPSMTYSSALDFSRDGDLERAQHRKYAALADAIGAKPGDHLLEIGCGWGGFAEYAALERGCRVTGLTISREQYDFAKRRAFEAGLAERIEIQMRDYRDERGAYDGLASIEMFEAVGEEYWPAFFAQVRDRLKSGARAGLQIITIDEAIFPRYRRELDFIRRYIFPGGMLPTRDILEKLGQAHGLSLTLQHAFGQDYALTLARWRDRFRASWPAIGAEGFDERFRRMWEYYLAYCEAGFRSSVIDVRQMAFTKA
ncbi:MAG: class I SAM-dependent methyltransferase [Hyphomicrobiales bacterium]|nr:class I SAM-dependent methyltransferase [Hyphomicrobiales bacterium]